MNDQRFKAPSFASAMPGVSGSTDVYLILGDPVEQVLAPDTFNPLFARFGHDAVLVPVQVAPEHLKAFVKTAFLAKNIPGMWVTIPHKVPVMDVLDHCSALARLAGAVNAVRRNADGTLEGGLFDGQGFLNALDYFGIAYAGKKVLVLGAGGAAAAMGASLVSAAAPVAELAFYDPAPGRAAEVAARLIAASPMPIRATAQNDPEGFDLIVNASPLGMHPGDPLPLDVTRLAAHAAVMDIVMKNQPTPLVQAVRARGLQAEPGFEMLIQQAHLYLEFFGMADAAKSVQQDATALRECIYPAALQGEIRRNTAHPVPTL